MHTRIHAGLHPGDEHQAAGRQNHRQHQLDGGGDLADDAADLLHDHIHLDHGHRGEFADKAVEEWLVIRPQVKTGHEGRRVVRQQPRRENQEEIGAHGLPVQLPQVGHLCLQRLRPHQEAHPVTHLDTHALGKFPLHRHQRRVCLGRPPLAGDQAVARGQRVRPGEIGLPLAPLRLGVVSARQLLAIHRHDSTANHGIQRLAGDVLAAQHLVHRLHILGADIDHEVIRRTLGQLGLPGIDQRGAHQHQYQQQHDGHGEDHHLHGIGATATLQAGQRQPPDAARAHAHQAAATQQGERQAQAQQRGNGKARQHRQGQLPIGAVPPHEQGDRHQAHQVVPQGPAIFMGQVAAQHPQGAGQAQAPQRRPGKAQQAGQRGGGANCIGAGSAGTRLHRHLLGEQGEKQGLYGPAQQATQGGGHHPQQQQAATVEPVDPRRGGAQAFHDRHVIGVALAETARRQRDRHAGQYYPQAARQQQKALGAPQGAAYPRLPLADIQQALAVLQLRFQPVPEALQDLGRRGVQLPVLHPAAGLHHAGGGNIVIVHQHPGAVATEGSGLVGFRAGRRGHGEIRLADGDALTDGHVQQRKQARLQPHLTRCRAAGRGQYRPEGLLAVGQLAAQGIAVADGLHRHQLHALVAGKHHRGEHQGQGLADALRLGLLQPLAGQGPGTAGHQVGGEKAMALLGKGVLQAGGKGADAGHHAHRQHQRHQQHAQLAPAPVAGQHFGRGH